MVSVKYNKLTHGVYSEKISPFINPFLHTNPGFFKPFSSIIVDLGYPMGVILVNRIPSAGAPPAGYRPKGNIRNW